MTWTNQDGLVVRFGTEKGTAPKAGTASTMGDEHEIRVKIKGTDVPSADAPVEVVPTVGIPTGAYITEATLFVTTAFVGATATLDLGLFHDDGDGTYSVYDADGIDSAIAVTAIDAIGDKVSCDGAFVAAPHTVVAGTGGRPVYVSYGYNTAAFTAGEGELIVKYRLHRGV